MGRMNRNRLRQPGKWAALTLAMALVVGVFALPVRVLAQPGSTAAADTSAAPAVIDTLPLPTKKRFGLVAGELVGINVFVWSYNNFLRPDGNDGFRVGTQSWWENIKNGFEWDDNNFNTNQFAHPYHGNLYFNAARTNNYNFWEAIPFTFAGSFMWEYFGETHHPSINDWFSTSLGGIGLGEPLYRFSKIILDNTATGSNRFWRELGGTLVNPVGGFTRLVTGEAFDVHENPPDRYPNHFQTRWDVGLRTLGEDRIWENDTTRVFMEFDFQYGNPFEGAYKKPFETFRLEAQLNFSDPVTVIGRLQTYGILGATVLNESEKRKSLLAGTFHFDYYNNVAFEYGSQSVNASLFNRWKTSGEGGAEMYLTIGADAILMGATKSDYFSFTGRNYDYGPGLGFRFSTMLRNRGWSYLRIDHNTFYLHIVNGNKANHVVSLTRARLTVPLRGFFGVGGEYDLYLAERNYQDFPDVSQRNPEARLFITWQQR
jgi:hypothetical protein